MCLADGVPRRALFTDKARAIIKRREWLRTTAVPIRKVVVVVAVVSLAEALAEALVAEALADAAGVGTWLPGVGTSWMNRVDEVGVGFHPFSAGWKSSWSPPVETRAREYRVKDNVSRPLRFDLQSVVSFSPWPLNGILGVRAKSAKYWMRRG